MTSPKKPREFWINDASGKYAIGSKAIKGAFKVREVVGAQKVDEDLNKAAETFVASNQCEVMDTTMAHEDTFKAGAEWQKAKEIEVLKERWVECAESHTDIEMELRDLKLHSAKVREQTVREIASYVMWMHNTRATEFPSPASISLSIESKFPPKREEKE